jgi:iron complex transport system substrate-binding protein
MKRSLSALGIVVVVFAAFLTGCSQSQEAGEEISAGMTLVDGLGREVSLAQPAQKIVSLAPSITEILYAIGAGDQIVGREDFSNYPEEALALPSVGGSFGELNTEAILALEPDLVLAAPITTAEQVQAMEELGITVFMLDNPVEFEGVYEMLRTAAQLTGKEIETEGLIDSLQGRVYVITETIAAAETTPLVFYELDSTEPSAPWTSGQGTFIDTLITLAGGSNLGAEFEGAWVQVSAEDLVAKNPDVIILGDSIWGVTPEDVGVRPGWEAIAAVQEGQVYPFNDDMASRPGPRLVDGLEELARLIHPELFA